MALTGNIEVAHKFLPYRIKRGVVAGAITIYKGALLNANSSGFLKLASDTATEKFAGIAIDDALTQLAGGSNGDNEIEIYPKDSGVVVRMTIQDSTTIANIGDTVYAYGDDKVALAGTTTNDIPVGTIINWVSANVVDVKI